MKKRYDQKLFFPGAEDTLPYTDEETLDWTADIGKETLTFYILAGNEFFLQQEILIIENLQAAYFVSLFKGCFYFILFHDQFFFDKTILSSGDYDCLLYTSRCV